MTQQVIDIQEFINRHARWAEVKFPDETVEHKLIHLKKEVDEVIACPKDLHEWADVTMLLFNALHRSNYNFAQLFMAMEEKFIICQQRKKWKKTVDGDYQHE